MANEDLKIKLPPVEVEGYVGVKDGQPIFGKSSDDSGDVVRLKVFRDAEDATARFFNVRRVRVIVDDVPVRAPEDWGAIDG